MTQDNTAGVDDKIVDRIQKLIAKASDPGCTEEESQAFFAKAYALMAKWQIDDAVLRIAGQRDPDDVIVRERIEGMPWTTFKHRSLLWHFAAKYNSCMAVLDVQSHARKIYERDEGGRVIYDEKTGKAKSTRARGGILLVGYKSDLERVKMIASGLDLHMLAAGTQSVRNLKAADKYYGREAFNHGYVLAVGDRMNEVFGQAKREAETASPGVGLALIDREEEVRATMEGKTQKGRGVSASTRGSHEQFRAGQEAGATADIGATGASISSGQSRTGAHTKELR